MRHHGHAMTSVLQIPLDSSTGSCVGVWEVVSGIDVGVRERHNELAYRMDKPWYTNPQHVLCVSYFL